MRRLSLMIMIAATLLVGACNTLQGVGKDLEKGGEAIQKAANK
ncbi:MAG: entericidin A/B family lipoprotein [Sterolibacterium sp.]